MIKYLLVIASAILIMAVPRVSSAADLFNNVCDGPNTAASAVCNKPTASNPIVGPDGVLIKVTHIIAIVAGAGAVIVIIIGAIRFITSSGDSNGVNSAKQTILFALIGLVVIVFAQALIAFIISKL